MARQKGIIKLKGRIGDISFFKGKRGYQAREATGVDAARIATDPVFTRTRENGSEFGSVARSTKVLRDSIKPLLMNVSTLGSSQRLMKLMTTIKNMDSTSNRGDRNVGVGIQATGATQFLKGFNFNDRAILSSVLFKAFTLNPANGDVQLKGFVPINELVYPRGATHVTFRSAWSKVDFVTGIAAMEQSAPVNVAIDGTAGTHSFAPLNVPVGSGVDFYFLKIEFFQAVNNTQYSLKNGIYNVVQIIEVI